MFPVKEICDIAKKKGLMTYVDGAHAIGQVPIDLKDLKADIYTGACHKWMMTPKGNSFLFVRKELQSLFDPLVISWGYESAHPSNSKFIDYHQMQGTRDFSAFLTTAKAIEFREKYNWEKVSADCRNLIRKNALRFCELLNSYPLAPLTDDFFVQMISIPIQTTQPENLYKLLFEKYRIEIPIMVHHDKIFLRISIQGYNSQEDLDKLYVALEEIISKTDLLSVKTNDKTYSKK